MLVAVDVFGVKKRRLLQELARVFGLQILGFYGIKSTLDMFAQMDVTSGP